MDGITVTGKVVFDGNGRLTTDTNEVLTLTKENSIGFIKALEISDKTTQEFTLTNGTKDAIAPFDVNGLSGKVVFGITIANVPAETTVTLKN